MIVNLFLHPILVLKNIFLAPKLLYLLQLLVPVAGLALGSWPILITLPLLGLNILSADIMTFHPHFYHSALLAPFLYFSAIGTVRRLADVSAHFRKVAGYGILAGTVVACLWFSTTPLSGTFAREDYQPSGHARLLSQVAAKIPNDALLSVQHNLGPHFTQRRQVYRFPVQKDAAEYVLLDEHDPYENTNGMFDFAYALQMDKAAWAQEVEALRRSPDHELIYDKDGYLLFKKK